MSKTKFEHITKMRQEQARQIRFYCSKQYPDCANCDYGNAINKRLIKCNIEGKPFKWEVV